MRLYELRRVGTYLLVMKARGPEIQEERKGMLKQMRIFLSLFD